jgi:uncharacterized protein (TIGR02757 family)
MAKHPTKIKQQELREFLNEKVALYNTRNFIPEDPISIPHLFTKKQDIEVAGLFAATIAWGNRKSIVANARKLMQMMDDAPADFVQRASAAELKNIGRFVHRTFNGEDAADFVRSLRKIYQQHDSLETLFGKQGDALERIIFFRKVFVGGFKTQHAHKHVSDPASGSAAKRLNMYLRWMVRKDQAGVDLGIWNKIRPAELMLPLDVHTGNVARRLGLLERKQNDAKAVMEVTARLREFDPSDPVKYDFALFGLGVYDEL